MAEDQGVSSDLAALKAKVDYLVDLAEQNRRTLRGANGELGLVAKVDRMGVQLTTIAQERTLCPINQVTETLWGDRDDPGKPGLLETVRLAIVWQKKFDNRVNKLTWILIAAVATVLLDFFIQLFSTYSAVMQHVLSTPVP